MKRLIAISALAVVLLTACGTDSKKDESKDYDSVPKTTTVAETETTEEATETETTTDIEETTTEADSEETTTAEDDTQETTTAEETTTAASEN